MTNTVPDIANVRAARPDDAAALATLAREFLAHERQFNPQMSELTPWAATAAELRKQLRVPNTQFFVAEQGGVLVGYVKAVAYGMAAEHVAGWRRRFKENCINTARRAFDLVLRRPRPNVAPTGGYIAGIFVMPGARRCHIGSSLVRAAEAWLRARGMPASELQVLYANPAARQFWEHMGYAPLALSLRKPLPNANDHTQEAT